MPGIRVLYACVQPRVHEDWLSCAHARASSSHNSTACMQLDNTTQQHASSSKGSSTLQIDVDHAHTLSLHTHSHTLSLHTRTQRRSPAETARKRRRPRRRMWQPRRKCVCVDKHRHKHTQHSCDALCLAICISYTAHTPGSAAGEGCVRVRVHLSLTAARIHSLSVLFTHTRRPRRTRPSA